ncbi:hypothetical protein E4T56_gene13724 [Termitomyces sp. T112]|nr:hypothetical protein E4T56_gene13724 [Termitomyces sp. T112]
MLMHIHPPVKAEPVHDAESNGMLASLGSLLIISSDLDNKLPIVSNSIALYELCPVPKARACSSCFIPDPTSLCSVRSLIFYSMLHPRPNLTSFGLCISNLVLHFRPNLTLFGLCISNSVLHPRPNLTSFG